MKKNLLRMKLHYWLFVFAALFVASCSSDDDDIVNPQEVQGSIYTEETGATLVNSGKIVIGTDEKDLVFTRYATVLKPNGWKVKKVMDCAGIVSLPFVEGENVQDTLKSVDNTTLINRGTIEIHTKKMVELYESMIYNPEDNSAQADSYEYLRMFGICASGKNSTIINEGLIDIYFDHDPNTPIWVYCFAMAGGEDCKMINKGTIRFHGNGSRRTRMRGIGMLGNHSVGKNEGTIEMDVEMAEDSRMITCGSDSCTIENNGIMKGRVPGTLLGMTHYGLNTIVNNNLIDLTSVGMPEGQASVLTDDTNIVCGFYEAYNKGRLSGIPPMVNKGTVNIRIEGTATTADSYQGYGMMCDMISACKETVEIYNEGTISTSQTGPKHYNMAEAGFICRSTTKDAPCHISLKNWSTTLRDFSQTHDLFLAKGVIMDFTEGNIRLSKAGSYVDGTSYSIAPEDLMYNIGDADYTYEYTGYDKMVFSSADKQVTLNWDKENRKVSLTK